MTVVASACPVAVAADLPLPVAAAVGLSVSCGASAEPLAVAQLGLSDSLAVAVDLADLQAVVRTAFVPGVLLDSLENAQGELASVADFLIARSRIASAHTVGVAVRRELVQQTKIGRGSSQSKH